MGIHKGDMGLWEYHGDRGKAYRKVWSQGTGKRREKKATPEEIAKQNQWRRERDVRRLIKWNFSSGDYWMTLTYKKGERPAWEQMKKDLAKLIRKVRLKYKKKGWELKYIYRLAIGKKGGPHVHLLVNREADQETGTDRIISELWENGHVYFASLYDAGGYVKLSEYITKPLEEHEPDEIKRYSCSRNLIRKEPKQKEIKEEIWWTGTNSQSTRKLRKDITWIRSL